MDNQSSHLPRYKTLEETIQRLERSQRKREQQKSLRRLQKKQNELPSSGSGRKTLPALRPSTVPARGQTGKRSPTEECNVRRDLEDKFESRMQQLLDEKMELNKKLSRSTSKTYKLQKQIRDKKSSLAVLKDQDNINQRRQEMMKKCGHEQQVLQDTNMQMAILSNYTRTLNLMKNRLWLNQTTFKKTMDEYYKTMNAQMAEVADVTKMKENAALKLTKARERNKKFDKLAAEALASLEKQLDGLRYVDSQNREYVAKVKKLENARRTTHQRRANETRAHSITNQLRESTEHKKRAQLLEKLDEHEDAFRKIQMASGLETDEEIIDAFNNRDAYLSDVVRKVDMLRRQLNEAQKQYNVMKAAFVSELVETDAAGGAALVMNIWGGKKDSTNGMDLSTELLQQKRLELQRVQREQSNARNLIIRFAQAIEGVHDSVEPMLSAKLDLAAFFTEEANNHAVGRRGGRGSRPGSKRGKGGRTSTPNKSKAERRHRPAPGSIGGGSILTSAHLGGRVSAIDQIATQLSTLILDTQASKEAPLAADNENEEPKAETAAKSKGTAVATIGPDYADKIADFMRAQKFAVHNNVRVKSLAVAVDTPDDRQSFFLKESKAQREREQMEDMLDESGQDHVQVEVDHDSEIIFDRDSMKKSSLTLVSKNTRKQKKKKKSKETESAASPKRASSASPRRGSTIRSSAPGEN